MSEYYMLKNGLAQYWDRDHQRLELSKWAYHNPELLIKILDFYEKHHQEEDNEEEE